MYQDRIMLDENAIYEKEFKVDTRGYRPQEVDEFLDKIRHDYLEYDNIIAELKGENKELTKINSYLEQEVRKLKTETEVIKGAKASDVTSSDLLKRVSNLEKIIYGKE